MKNSYNKSNMASIVKENTLIYKVINNNKIDSSYAFTFQRNPKAQEVLINKVLRWICFKGDLNTNLPLYSIWFTN